jgi:hypothetical protein
MNYLIAYDLNRPGQNYQDLISALKQMGAQAHQKSAWLLSSGSTSKEILDWLLPHIDATDSLIVAEYTTNVASYDHQGIQER